MSAGEVAVVVLAESAPGARLWGWWQIVRGPRALKRRVPGLRFAKVLGSGHEGGFGLRPSGSRLGLFLLFEHEAAAEAFVADSALLRDWRAHTRELCIAQLRTSSARGSWDGQALQVTAEPSTGPVAVLTRASIRPSRALAFWRLSPASESALAHAPGCLLSAGLGEAPLLRQATFSVWDSLASMQAYARGQAHGEAARSAYAAGCFSESMFVRFVPLALSGTWKGKVYG
jgi:spheroidene monooxygenase